MGYSLGGLTKYVDQSDLNFHLASSVLPVTSKYVTVLSGIKSDKALNILSSNPVWQDGAGCSSTTAGTTTISQRIIKTKPVTIRESLCERDLEDYFTQLGLAAGANNYTEAQYYEAITKVITSKIAEQVNEALWAGEESTKTNHLEFFDGWLEHGVQDLNASGSTVVSISNVRSVLDQVWTSLPAKVRGQKDVTIFVDPATFGNFALALVNANLYHIQPQENLEYLTYPGYPGAKIVCDHGMAAANDGKPVILATYKKNIVQGVDLEADPSNFKVEYINYDETIRYTVRFRLGTQFAFVSEAVSFLSK